MIFIKTIKKEDNGKEHICGEWIFLWKRRNGAIDGNKEVVRQVEEAPKYQYHRDEGV